jgi:hypothetical protein
MEVNNMVSSISTSNSYDSLNYVGTTDNKTSSSIESYSTVQNSVDEISSTLENTGDDAINVYLKGGLLPTILNTSIDSTSTKEEFFNTIAGCPGNQISSFEDFTESCNVAKILGKDYLGSDDSESLYKEYMNYRECDSQEDLKALSSVYPTCTTTSDLRTVAKMDMAQTSAEIEGATRTNNDVRTGLTLNSELSNDILSNASVTNLANYVNNFNNSQSNSFETQVSNLQSFLSSVSKQGNVSSELQSEISGYSQKISSSADEITEYSNKIEKSSERNSEALTSEKYRASLIAQYQS